MKTSLLGLLTAATLLGTADFASAQAFLTDDFTVTTNVELDPNFEIENRQTGTLALSGYTVWNGNGSGHGVQLGNMSTDVGQPNYPNNGNFLLLADNYGVQNDLVIDDFLAEGKPLNFTFDLYVKSQNTNLTHWSSFTLRAPGNTFVIAQAGEFGMLRRANGGMQFFTNGGAFFELDPGTSTSSLFSVTFSDRDGTGSAFAGNGSRVVVFNDGVQILDYDFDGGSLNPAGLFAGWAAELGAVGGLDNLSIAAVPEPSTIATLIVGGLGLTLVAWKRRAA